MVDGEHEGREQATGEAPVLPSAPEAASGDQSRPPVETASGDQSRPPVEAARAGEPSGPPVGAGSARDRSRPPVGAPSDLGVGIGAPVLARMTARISPALLQELIDWARDGVPNEACGIIAGDRFATDGGHALRFHALTNKAASPYRYLVDPEEQLRAMTSIDDADEVVWGIFHSHVASPAEPSPTDIELAFYPGSLYLICSLADPLRPVIRAWTIEDGQVEEVTLEVG